MSLSNQPSEAIPGTIQQSYQIDAELLPFFRQEASEIFSNFEKTLSHWEITPADPSPSKIILRLFHTIKGSAHSIGLIPIGKLAHEMEDIMKSFCDGIVSYESQTLIHTIRSVVNGIRTLLESIPAGSSFNPSHSLLTDLNEQIQSLKSNPIAKIDHPDPSGVHP